MRKVLLVDDDHKSLTGIKTMLLRGNTGFKDITECTDGVQAEALLKNNRYDLVITDIKMPNMDGINFIRRSQMIAHKPKFLIISGYQDFGFAKEAIKYGVKEYLLKPVGRTELLASVNKIEEDLNQEDSFSENSKNEHLISLRIFKEINFIFLNEKLMETEIRSVLNSLELSQFFNAFYIYVADEIQKNLQFKHGLTQDNPTSDLIQTRFKALSNEVLIFNDFHGKLVFISPDLLNSDYLLNELETGSSRKYAIGLGKQGNSPGMIRSVYLQALEALKYKVFIGEGKYGKLITYQETESLSTDYIIPVGLIKKVPEMVGTQEYVNIESLIRSLFNKEAISGYPIDYVEKIADYLYSYIFQFFSGRMPFEFAFLEQNNRKLKKIENYGYLQEYLNDLWKYLNEINHFFMQSLDDTKIDKVDTAIKFIKENYHRNINLTYVANHVSLNYNYFSNVFHQKTGMRFVEYLNLLRINRAKELLGNSENISEIAKEVGYASHKHFTRIFKAFVGVSPYDYRKKLRL